jgi:two-component system cell cycle sensor histidine kinase/response regulator CckA
MEAIGTLAGGIAHDFNNILAAMMGYAELASLDAPEGSKANMRWQEVLKAGLRARDLVQQILTFSRQSSQERKPVEIGPIVKETLKLLRASLPSTVEIRQHVESNADVIETDPTQIHQVLMNLCTNAAHAMRESGGILEVSLNKVDMEEPTTTPYPDLHAGPYVRLSVSDTGHGIPPQLLKRIFDPYFTTKPVGEGTGLGLAVVHGIVKSHGGEITVSSKPGKGTTFHVYLPGTDGPKEVAASQRVEPYRLGRQECLLLIDDEQALVEVGKQMLEHLGYRVIVRTSSVEALELFRNQPEKFDLVITDMTMPNMTGDKLAREMMGIRPGMPIILCTGFSEHIAEEKVKKIGIREFVMKPLVMSDLSKTIRRVLDQK